MSELLTEDSMEQLISLATKYAEAKNLYPDIYVSSMIEPMMRDAERLDLNQMVATLIRYHKEWLR
jgi:hypothetical protein